MNVVVPARTSVLQLVPSDANSKYRSEVRIRDMHYDALRAIRAAGPKEQGGPVQQGRLVIRISIYEDDLFLGAFAGRRYCFQRLGLEGLLPTAIHYSTGKLDGLIEVFLQLVRRCERKLFTRFLIGNCVLISGFAFH